MNNRKKRVSYTVLTVIIIAIIILCSPRTETMYSIRYKAIKFDSPEAERNFKQKLISLLKEQGYIILKERPEWAGIYFDNIQKRKIQFLVNIDDKSAKGLFYIENHPFEKNGLLINYRYIVTSHPWFIESKNKKMRSFALDLPDKIPELIVEEDEYTIANGSKTKVP